MNINMHLLVLGAIYARMQSEKLIAYTRDGGERILINIEIWPKTNR